MISLEKITINKSPSADSRSAKTPPTVDQLTAVTEQHITDVQHAMKAVADEIIHVSEFHDHTKLEHMDQFHQALTSGHIKDTDWYKMHITEERHHLKSNVPSDVTLIDVIEHLCDCVMAGMARTGEVYDVDISPEVLTLACENTVELLKTSTEVTNDDNAMDTEVTS